MFYCLFRGKSYTKTQSLKKAREHPITIRSFRDLKMIFIERDKFEKTLLNEFAALILEGYKFADKIIVI